MSLLRVICRRFKAVNTSTATAANVGALANNTYVTVGFHYSANSGLFRLFFNDVYAGTIPLTNVPATSTALALTLGALNGTSQGTGATLSTDYFMIAKQRTANG